tara:strand:+ start:459 stop:593 length:135 start_codon:yes stop_codon:yes gene_type:complete
MYPEMSDQQMTMRIVFEFELKETKLLSMVEETHFIHQPEQRHHL